MEGKEKMTVIDEGEAFFEEEAFLRKELKGLRAAATSLQRSVMLDEIFCRDPVFQAEAIIKGYSYRLPSRLLVRALLATGELELEDVAPECGYSITEEEAYKRTVEKAERFLKEKFDPVDITREITMPLVRWWLEAIERYVVEQGYRLPKWRRPAWLEMKESTK